MSKTAVFCIAASQPQAVRIANSLKDEGFQESDISVLFPGKEATRDFAHEQNTKAPEGAATGAGAGGLLGGGLGWLIGIGSLAIPGVGPFIAAGPIMAALGGAAIGAAVGGIGGALVGMGLPELEAKQYEGKIRSGNILISVHTDNANEVDRAKMICKREGATDISTTKEAAVPASERSAAIDPGAPGSPPKYRS
jgi:hypothetical protein